MTSALQELQQYSDVGSLESALRSLCSEFGALSHLDILTMSEAGKRHALCLLRLDTSEQERGLMTRLGANRFGEDLCVVVDLRAPDPVQS